MLLLVLYYFVGLALLALGVAAYKNDKDTHRKPVTGTVVSSTEGREWYRRHCFDKGREAPCWHLEVEYVVAEEVHSFQRTVFRPVREGETIKLLYSPGCPEDVEPATEKAHFLKILGCVLFALGVAVIVWAFFQW
ncbi:MAG: hypothetical protein GX580_10585 [Candidatus Hydrogenedens sp.]|nr:hypothetical protein [Candidatus Hydrogenedens sp.]